MRLSAFAFSLALLVSACGKGSSDDSGSTTGTPGGTTGGAAGGVAGGTVSTAGWNLTGTAIDFAAQAPATEGLCIELLDPSPALTGGEPVVLVASTIGANGAIDLTGIKTTSVLGLLASVKDCGGLKNQTVFTSATGVPYEDIRYMSEGETLADVTALVITMPFLAAMQASLEAVGYTGDLATEGFVFGLVADNAGTPLAGATVTCQTCPTAYYLDENSADGLFGAAATANTATSAAAGGVFIVPAGPVGQYTAEDGGAHSFPTQINGSTPGSAMITAIYAY